MGKTFIGPQKALTFFNILSAGQLVPGRRYVRQKTASGLARSLAETGSSIEAQFLANRCPRMEQASHCSFILRSYVFEYPSNIKCPTSI